MPWASTRPGKSGVTAMSPLSPELIRPAPELGPSVRTEHVMGSWVLGRRVVMLVDMDRMPSDAGFQSA
ncbi:MAG TPA: hypothetical protein VEB70_00070 [Noviherbaspirillum sp.]|nr:hypothetical protein [Noviherbaspirillum sp.]